MTEMVQVLAKYGYWLLFVAVLGRQACLPVPANLLLVAAGALAGLGRLSAFNVVAFSVTAFLVADLAWYKAGQRWGSSTLHFIGGATRGQTARVDRITATFTRHGVKSLLVSKFIVGLDAVAAPMSGVCGISLSRFLIFDALGATLWACAYTALGYIFSDQLDHIAIYSAKIGVLAAWTVVAGMGALVIHRLVRLYRFFCEFRLARITPDQLKSKLVAGENILLLDLQGGEEHCQGLIGIPGSVRIDPRLLGRYKRQYRDVDLAMDCEVVLYCANQGERHSARVALALRRRGFEHVRPLAGGLQAWRDCGFPVTRDIQMLPSPEHGVYVLREILHYSPANSAQALKTSVANIVPLLERAQERIGSSEDTHLLFLQHCHRQDVASSIRNAAAAGPLGPPGMTK
jgi:membrane protein DedA with SNARE-associated domain/rhodanese-related sulfurtransferase